MNTHNAHKVGTKIKESIDIAAKAGLLEASGLRFVRFGVGAYGVTYCQPCALRSRLYGRHEADMVGTIHPCHRCGESTLVCDLRGWAKFPRYTEPVKDRRVKYQPENPEIHGLLSGAAKGSSDPRLYVGVELEFASKYADTEAERAALSDNGTNLRDTLQPLSFVSLAHDGSVSPSGLGLAEARVFGSVGGSLRPRLVKVCRTIRESGGFVNQTTGLHVHLNMRSVGQRGMARAAARLRKALPALCAVQPASRATSTYCRLHGRGDRYQAVNTHSFHEHGTLEVRLGAGSLNAEKIIAWASILLIIAHGQDRMPAYFGPDQLTAVLQRAGRTDLITWYAARRAQLGADNAAARAGLDTPPVRASRARTAAEPPLVVPDSLAPVSAAE